MIRILAACLSLAVVSFSASAQNFEIDIAQFDNWIFSGMQNAQVARTTLAARAKMEIQRISFSTPLRDEQVEKLEFAAKGDIKRFYDDVEKAHRQFHAMQAAGEINQANLNDVYQIASPLAQRLNQGLFGKDSLLKKVAHNCVDNEQADKLRAGDKLERKRQSDTAVTAFIANLGRQIPMTHSQREDLLSLLSENVSLSNPSHQYVAYQLMYEMSELPQPKLKAIFDEAQYKALEKSFAQGIMMKANLKRMGLMGDE